MYKQEENPKKKDGKQHENQISDIEKEKKAKRTPKAKHKKEAALTPIATKIATSPLHKTQTKRLNEGEPRFRVRSKCTEEWNGDWRRE